VKWTLHNEVWPPIRRCLWPAGVATAICLIAAIGYGRGHAPWLDADFDAHPGLLRQRGQIAQALGDYARAESYYRKALNMYAAGTVDYFGAALSLGRLYLQQGRIAEVSALLQPLLPHPFCPLSAYELCCAALWNREDYARLAEIAEQYRRRAQMDKNVREESKALLFLGRAAARLGRREQAAAYWEAGIQISGDTGAQVELALLRAAEGQTDVACTLLHNTLTAGLAAPYTTAAWRFYERECARDP